MSRIRIDTCYLFFLCFLSGFYFCYCFFLFSEVEHGGNTVAVVIANPRRDLRVVRRSSLCSLFVNAPRRCVILVFVVDVSQIAKVFFHFVLSRGERDCLCTARYCYQQLEPLLSPIDFYFPWLVPFDRSRSIRSSPRSSYRPTSIFLIFLLPVSRPLFISSVTANTISTERSPRRRYRAGKENEYFMETDRYWGVHYRYCPLLRIDLKERRKKGIVAMCSSCYDLR